MPYTFAMPMGHDSFNRFSLYAIHTSGRYTRHIPGMALMSRRCLACIAVTHYCDSFIRVAWHIGHDTFWHATYQTTPLL